MAKKPEEEKATFKTPAWILISIIIISIVLLLCFCSDIALSSGLSNANTTIDDLDQTVSSYDNSISAVQIKTTDLNYSSGVSTFSQTLNVGSKNVGNTISKMSYSNNNTLFESNLTVQNGYNLYIGSMNVQEEIDQLNDAIINGTFKIDDVTLLNLTVANLTKTNTIVNSQSISTDKLFSDTITNDGNFSNSGMTITNGIENTGTISNTNKIISPFYSCAQYPIVYPTLSQICQNLGLVGGISIGTGDGNSKEVFNLAIGSWNSTAFVDTTELNLVKVLIDHRSGIITSSANVTDIGCSSPAAYLYKTTTNGGEVSVEGIYPVTCSMAYPPYDQIDHFWSVNPGYEILTYNVKNYGRSSPDGPITTAYTYKFENINGITPKFFEPNADNFIVKTTKSFRVFYKGVEVTAVGLSGGNYPPPST